ncbi:MAG: hypothetical protein CBC55_00085 [Gammaproteobacteria bacterium TMED95]|nr:MAG: hypothetical protein CBC55_00085 [Gammaproteobacteria bacterium TMED95]
MSIDREINARVDAYGKNPQALQKKYAMTKELVDLLALQKIKKSMDSARAAVEAQMQTNPATIKQQREQEVFGRTAQDVAQQLGGVLQTAKNQQMAQRRPAPQGLGALMPQQGQRPQQLQRMQAGGIVAFQGGGGVDKQIAELINRGLSDDEIRAEAARLGLLPQAADRIIQQVRLQQKQDMSLQPPQPKTRSIDLASDDPVLATQGTQPPPQPKTPSDPDPDPDPDPTNTGIATAAKGFPKVTNEDGTRKSATQLVTEMEPLESPQIDTSKANEAGLAVLKDFGMGPDTLKDPEQYRKDVRDDEADFSRRKEKMENYQRMIDRQEALNAEQSDPKTLAREQLQAGLIGMAGRGSTAGAGFGAGAMTMGRSQKRDAQTRLKTVADMVDNMEKQDFEVAKSASAAGRDALAQAATDRRTALTAMYTMRGQELDTIRKQAEMDYNANKDNIKNLLDASVADATSELRQAIQEGNDLQRAMAILQNLTQQNQRALDTLRENFTKSMPYLKALQDYQNAVQKRDDEGARTAKQTLDRLEQEYAVRAEQMLSDSGSTQLEAELRKRIGFDAPQPRFDTSVDDGFGKMTVTK